MKKPAEQTEAIKIRPAKREIPPFFTREYRTVSQVKGPLIFANHISGAAYNEIVEIIDPQGGKRRGRILEVDRDVCMIQVFIGTEGLDLETTRVRLTGDVARLGVSLSMLGRIFDGMGHPIDGGPPVLPEKMLDINGLPINPTVRLEPREFIQTGISAIDGLNSLARGQKLPIFSGSGLPGNELAAQIASQARVIRVAEAESEPFAVVFAAIGITHRETAYFIEQFRQSGALERTVVFLNHADDPTIERLLTPRAALTVAEYLAFMQGRHVLVIMTDMTNYCEALREVAAAREEIPGRRGYPGYMYSDLASLYERAGRLRGNPGSITQLILLTMPDDDISHPIPDLTGYITEGQIVLSRVLHQQGIYPPINVLHSLSRLMKEAIGARNTREDHRTVADQLYSLYDEGCNLRRLKDIVGEAALSRQDRQILNFAEAFETKFIHQGGQNREIETTLGIAWDLLSALPPELLKRIPLEFIHRYHHPSVSAPVS